MILAFVIRFDNWIQLRDMGKVGFTYRKINCLVVFIPFFTRDIISTFEPNS